MATIDGALLRFCLAAGLAALGSAPLFAQATGTVRGTVLDDRREPVEDALVTIPATGTSRRTDRQGGFRFERVAGGLQQLDIRALGLGVVRVQVEVLPGVVRDVTITLPPRVQQLDSIAVTADEPRPAARLTGFENRRRTGLGKYFVRADFERMMPVSTSQLFRLLPTGLTIRDSAGIPQAVSNRGKKLVRDPVTGGLEVRSCQLQMAVDGHVLPWGTSLDFVDPQDVLGVEIYQGAASIPAEYLMAKRDISCGLIIIWTRSGSEPDR